MASARAVISLPLAATIGTLLGLRWGAGTWWGQGGYGLAKLWLLALPLLWLWRMDRGRWRFSSASPRGLAVGAVLGLAVGAAIIAGYCLAAAQHWVAPQRLRALAAANKLTDPRVYLAFAAFTSLVNALLEEFTWRWFAVRRWEAVLPARRWSGPLAALLAAACFTVHHIAVLGLYFNWQAVLLGSTGVFLGGLLWSGLYVRYRSIWPGYLCHVLADVAIFWVGWQLIFGGS